MATTLSATKALDSIFRIMKKAGFAAPVAKSKTTAKRRARKPKAPAQ